MAEIKELLGFLTMATRADVRGTALEVVLGITASPERDAFFKANRGFIKAIATIYREEVLQPVVQDAVAALINLAHDADLIAVMLDEDIVETAVRRIQSAQEENPDANCMLLVNLTRDSRGATQLSELELEEGKPAIYGLVDTFCTQPSPSKHGNFDHLANVFFNITQSDAGRKVVMARSHTGCILQRLLPFIQYEDSKLRRGGVIGAFRNCCFNTEEHAWLLSDAVDLLPYLLLPLAGPEELDDDDMDGMPDDLQYLPPDKTREDDADIRKMILEALLQLAATRSIREILRAKKTYPILREYHNWEEEEDVQEVCEQVVQLLIQDESDIAPNMHEVEVPDDVAQGLDEIRDTLRQGQGPEIELVPDSSAAAPVDGAQDTANGDS